MTRNYQNEEVREAFFGPLSRVQETMGLFFIVFWGLMRAELMGSGGGCRRRTRTPPRFHPRGRLRRSVFLAGRPRLNNITGAGFARLKPAIAGANENAR